jgi:hypothetical protein
MGKVIIKKSRKSEVHSPESGKVQNRISDDDIRRRAYEIYLDGGGSLNNELDNWFRAERELRRSVK